MPDRRQKRLVFQACTAKMNLSDEVDLENFVSRPDKISNAEISAICLEAGMQAVRKNRSPSLTPLPLRGAPQYLAPEPPCLPPLQLWRAEKG